MQIQFSPEVEAQIRESAAQTNQTPEQLVAALVSERLSYNERFRKSVAQGLASLDAGKHVTQEEVEAYFASQLQS